MDDMEDMQEIIQEFLAESLENLDQLDNEFIALEENPNDTETLASIFRTIHSIKGTCGFLGFTKLEKVAHAGEDVLGLLRDGELMLNTEMASTLLTMLDAVREMLKTIEEQGTDGDNAYPGLIKKLITCKSGKASEKPPADNPAPANAPQNEVEPDPEKTAKATSPKKKTASKSHKKTPQKNKSSDKTFSVDPKDPESEGMLEMFCKDCEAYLNDFEKQLKSKTKNDENRYANLFRAMHGIKASASRIEFEHLDLVSGAIENVVAALRDEEIKENDELSKALVTAAYEVRKLIKSVGKNATDQNDYSDLLAKLNALAEGKEIIKKVDVPAVASEEKKAEISDDSKQDNTENTKYEASKAAVEYLRVDVHLLDTLVNLVGELVLARNQISQYSKNFQDRMLLGACQNLNLITSELQQACMKTRMQPISTAWNKIPRVVRDLAKGAKKEIKIEMTGKDTELDKSLLEAIKDPLTHMVRNSVDHGIETPEVRKAAGKPAEGTLYLQAYHEGGQVFIVISDDGAGIATKKVLDKAIEKNLLTEEQAKSMNDNEIAQLIFMPGFSTAEKVTKISGRGVGMDVVKTNIEKIGGFVSIINKPGKGSTFIVQLPLTLAIIPTLMVRSGEQNFAIPQVNAHKLIRMKGEQAKNCIEMVHGAPVYRLHGNLLPLVLLNKELHLESMTGENTVQIVVVQANHNRYGLVVDQILDNQEIVVKPLSEYLKPLSMFAGATIMGDGSVALILDIAGLAQHAGVLSETLDHAVDKENDQNQVLKSKNEQAMLIVQSEYGDRVAILLENVIHLKKFNLDEVEFAGHQKLVQYRDGIMPLISISQILEERRKKPRKNVNLNEKENVLPALIYKVNGQYVGLEVGSIIDIVTSDTTIMGPATRKGTMGTIVTQNLVTELFDINDFFALAENIVKPGLPEDSFSVSERL